MFASLWVRAMLSRYRGVLAFLPNNQKVPCWNPGGATCKV